MKKLILIVILIILQQVAESKLLDVGTGQNYSNLTSAVKDVRSGDTILFHEGTYAGNQYISNLNGKTNSYINILAEYGKDVVISGGSVAWMLSNVSFIRISGFIFEKQTGNGVNIDDGGNFSSPSHDLLIEDCSWRDMDATGNNDQLKLSGVDSSIVRRCHFVNGSADGSLIDMVGCHNNIFEDNTFLKAGANCIQAKGGCRYITIRRNSFTDGGGRSLNIGGSTDLQFFRPQGVTYEAANIAVYSNLFKGSTGAIAYVNAIDCEVVNNTIITPGRWTVRILQETVQSQFQKCGNNTFANNLIYMSNAATAENSINIGPNTAPETFTFSNNLWYNFEDSSWKGPNTSVPHLNTLVGIDPQFKDASNDNYTLLSSSPAIGKGLSAKCPGRDFLDNMFSLPPSIGCYEGKLGVRVEEELTNSNDYLVFPNPATDFLEISYPPSVKRGLGDVPEQNIEIFSVLGETILKIPLNTQYPILTTPQKIDVSSLAPGVYFVKVGVRVSKFIKI